MRAGVRSRIKCRHRISLNDFFQVDARIFLRHESVGSEWPLPEIRRSPRRESATELSSLGGFYEDVCQAPELSSVSIFNDWLALLSSCCVIVDFRRSRLKAIYFRALRSVQLLSVPARSQSPHTACAQSARSSLHLQRAPSLERSLSATRRRHGRVDLRSPQISVPLCNIVYAAGFNRAPSGSTPSLR
jgi:hypothetical protein